MADNAVLYIGSICYTGGPMKPQERPIVGMLGSWLMNITRPKKPCITSLLGGRGLSLTKGAGRGRYCTPPLTIGSAKVLHFPAHLATL